MTRRRSGTARRASVTRGRHAAIDYAGRSAARSAIGTSGTLEPAFVGEAGNVLKIT